MVYNTYRYIYPCRPKNAIPDTDLEAWEALKCVAQPKLNGSNCVIFTNGQDLKIMNRHSQILTNVQIPREEILALYKGDGWMVINGEYMNKSKQDESKKLFNHKLVIFDILVYKSDYLLGKTFMERIDLLDELYGKNNSDKDYLFSISENIYRTKSYESNFKTLYDELHTIDMVEGLVLKRINAKLEIGNTENNNSKSQAKCRKPTKNYKF